MDVALDHEAEVPFGADKLLREVHHVYLRTVIMIVVLSILH